MKIPEWANPNEWNDEARAAAKSMAIATMAFALALMKGKKLKELATEELKKLTS